MERCSRLSESVVVELDDALEDSVVRVLGNTVGAAAFVRLVAVVAVEDILNSYTIEIVPCSSSGGEEGTFFPPTDESESAFDHA